MKGSEKINEEYLNKIISAAYGDLGFINKIKIYLDAKKNPEVKIILDEYKAIAREVHSLKNEEYNGSIPVYHPQNSNFLLQYFNLFFKKPLLSTSLVLLLIGGVISGYLLMKEKQPAEKYSAAEILAAEQQVKESFAIVADIFNRTEDRLKNDILQKNLGQPVQKSLAIINNYLKGG